MTDIPPGYPARWEADVVLRDGATVHVRPIRPDDADLIVALHHRLSAETVYFRFFSPLAELPPRMLRRLVNVDYVDRLALVAELGDELVAVARYERLAAAGWPGSEAEVAFLVDDAQQGRGLGTVLLEHLAVAAKEAGITRFVAETLPENRRMLRVFHEAGFGDERRFADGVVRVVFPIAATEASLAASHERERFATARSVFRLLHPTSVAVIGASRDPTTLGYRLVDTLLRGGFNGPVYPVNHAADHVASVRAYPRVADIAGPVDLAVIAVPAASVASVVDECADKHVGGLIIVSSGFAETGPEGTEVQRQIVASARRHGMRLIGPNCMGAINTAADVRLNATFSAPPPPGRIGFICQSGGLGVVLLDEVTRRGLGLSTFVSVGNRGDVSSNDLLQYWDDDPATDVCLLYIESFGNPRVFARVARRVARRKPIVAVKSARSPAGFRAAGSPLQAEDDRMVDALFRQTGVIRTDTLEELFDVAQLLSAQPLPSGSGVAIVANAGGPGVLASDACSAAGLDVVTLADDTQQRLRRADPRATRPVNPVELAPDAAPDAFRVAIEIVLDDPAVDAVIALYTSPLAAPVAQVASAIGAAQSTRPTTPVLACVLGQRGLLPTGTATALPSYAFPEAAARALGQVVRYAEWRRRPVGEVPPLDGVDTDAARQVVAGALNAAGDSVVALGAAEAEAVLAAYGLAVTARPPGGAGHLVISVTQDRLFGPLVTIAGGAETARSGRATPLTDVDAADLIVASLGRAPDTGGNWDEQQRHQLRQVVLRVGRLADDIGELAALHLDVLAPTPDSVAIVGAEVRLAYSKARPELALRRL